jgi:uncharacterized protein YbjT (DUF2867 family)
MSDIKIVLVVGATGSIGRLVVDEAVQRGLTTRALVRDADRGRSLPAVAELVVGDLTDQSTLAVAVDGVDAVVFTHGAHAGDHEAVDYGGVLNVLTALGNRPARIALMTAIGVTVHDGPYNRSSGAHDWKRRSERLVRASGRPYTIVRPGWFDYNADDELHVQFLQGDTRRAGNSSDGVISRRQIAQVLVASLRSADADHKTLELVAEHGPAQSDTDLPFAALDEDDPGALDGVRDPETLPIGDEPRDVLDDIERIRSTYAA